MVALEGVEQLSTRFNDVKIYRVSFFWPPLNLAMSQAHYKFLYIGNFRGGQFKLHRAWDLVKLGGGARKKRHPVPSLDKST